MLIPQDGQGSRTGAFPSVLSIDTKSPISAVPTCAKGKSTETITVRYKLDDEWIEAPTLVIPHEWDTCKDACEGRKFVEGKCLKAKYNKPKKVSPGDFSFMGYKIHYEVIIREAVEEEICEYECEEQSKTPSKAEGKD